MGTCCTKSSVKDEHVQPSEVFTTVTDNPVAPPQTAPAVQLADPVAPDRVIPAKAAPPQAAPAVQLEDISAKAVDVQEVAVMDASAKTAEVPDSNKLFCKGDESWAVIDS